MLPRKTTSRVFFWTLGLFGLASFFLIPILVGAFTGPTTGAGVGGGALRTDSSKNVSVGTINPSANTKFLIQASSTSASDYSLRIVQPDGSTPLLIVRNDGRIGIGTAATSTALAVGGDAYISGSVTATTFSGSLTGTLSAANVSSGTFGSNTSFGNFTFGTSTNPILHIDNTNARVGVGTTSPGQKLEVIGNVSSTALCLGGACNSSWPSGGVTGSGTATRVTFWSDTTALSSDGNLYWDNTNKRLGIGTALPSASLHSTGQIRSSVAGGTAPFLVDSTTKVANLNADLLDGLDSSAFGDATAANQTTILSRIGTSADGAGTGTLFAHAARLYNQVDSTYATTATLMGIGSAPACPVGWTEIVAQTAAGTLSPVTSISTTGISPITSMKTVNFCSNELNTTFVQGQPTCGNQTPTAMGTATSYTVAAGGSVTTYTFYYRLCGLPR